jgi:hypothetical protein
MLLPALVVGAAFGGFMRTAERLRTRSRQRDPG